MPLFSCEIRRPELSFIDWRRVKWWCHCFGSWQISNIHRVNSVALPAGPNKMEETKKKAKQNQNTETIRIKHNFLSSLLISMRRYGGHRTKFQFIDGSFVIVAFVSATSCETAKLSIPTDYEMRRAIIKLRIRIQTQSIWRAWSNSSEWKKKKKEKKTK